MSRKLSAAGSELPLLLWTQQMAGTGRLQPSMTGSFGSILLKK